MPCATTTGMLAYVGQRRKESQMIILGVVLLVLGFVLHVQILWTIGLVLMVLGALLWVLGASGRAVGGRAHYW